MQITSDFNFENWTILTSGDGVCTLASGVISASSGAGTGSAIAYKRLKVFPGDVIKFSCMAVKTDGFGRTAPQIGIDFPVLATNVNKINLYSTMWQRVECEYVVPLTATYAQYITLSVGVPTVNGGAAQFAQPVVEIENTGFGAPRCIAMALLQMTSGSPLLNNNATQRGIKSISYSSTNKALSVFIEKFGDAMQQSPVFSVNVDSASTRPYLKAVTSFTRSTGEVTIKFYDNQTLVDVVTDATVLCNFMAMI